MRRSRISLPTNVQCATFVLGSGEGGHRPQSSSASPHLAGAAAWRCSGGRLTTRSTGQSTETSRSGVSRSGCARLGLQKDGLPIRCGSSYYRFKAIDARLRGSFPRLPLNSVARVKKSPTEAGLECQRRSAAGPPLRLENVGLWYFSSGMSSPNQRAPGVSASNHRPKAAPARADC